MNLPLPLLFRKVFCLTSGEDRTSETFDNFASQVLTQRKVIGKTPSLIGPKKMLAKLLTTHFE
jgi:hypothetical protein